MPGHEGSLLQPTKIPNSPNSSKTHNVRSTVKDGIESIIIIYNNPTIEPATVSFPHNHAEESSSLPSLATLQVASIEQWVQIKTKVSNITGIKEIKGRYGQTLQKQEVILVDHTISVKFVLRQEH